jgi:hypothetical protein
MYVPMNCPICTGGKLIPTHQLKDHLTTGQHRMNNDVATYIVYLLGRIENLEKRIQSTS